MPKHVGVGSGLSGLSGLIATVASGTAPLFASAEIGTVNATTVAVTFDSNVSASNYTTGVTVKVNGSSVSISSSTRQANHAIVYYAIPAVYLGDIVTWEYTGGNIVGETGSVSLGTVTAQSVTNNVTGLYTLISDAFTGADGTNLTAHAPDVGGAVWTQWAASFTIQSNAALAQGAVSYDVQETPYNDCTIVCKFKCGAANGNYAPSIVFRGTDSGHFLLVQFSGDGAKYIKRNSLGYATIATSTWTADANWHTATIVLSSTTVSTSIDGGAAWVVNNVTNTQYSGTFHGLLGFKLGGLSDSFDDFQVQGISLPAYPASYATVQVTENFGGADGTRLNTRGWTETVGTWTCQSGKGQQNDYPTLGAKGAFATRDVSANVAMQVSVTTPASGSMCPGFALRVQDGDHFIEMELNNSVTYNGWAGFGLWAYDGGPTFSVVAARYFQPQLNTTYTLRLRLNGNTFIAEVVEANLTLVCSSALFNTATANGIYESRPLGYGQSVFDDFTLRT